MNLLIAHNYYQQPGGEDTVFATHVRYLASQGHIVKRFTMDNHEVNSLNPLALVGKTIWNRESYQKLKKELHLFRADVALFHNTFPLISPSAYYAAEEEGVPVVQLLHNYRLICPNAQFFRKGKICEDCLGKFFSWPGVVHRCYRTSLPASAVVASMLTFHFLKQTWQKHITMYFTLTGFARNQFILGGLPAGKIMVVPNFLDLDPGIPAMDRKQGMSALYVGRLSEEKGIRILLEAWQKIGDRLPLKIIGDGPLGNWVKSRLPYLPGVQWMGHLPVEIVHKEMQKASFLIIPSLWYEGLPTVLIQAYANGLPVLASNNANLSTLIADGQTGRLFRAGSADDLAEKAVQLVETPDRLRNMSIAARAAYENHYTAQTAGAKLESLLKQVFGTPESTR
jgi:glycosyltransferase involved in cell wall biosynthesis